MLLIGAASSLIMPMVYCDGYRLSVRLLSSRTTELALRSVLRPLMSLPR